VRAGDLDRPAPGRHTRQAVGQLGVRGEHHGRHGRGARTDPARGLDKLTTIDAGTDAIDPADLPAKPDFCFVDGEHTDEAALRDARFCLAALRGSGVVAFHDYDIVRPGIRAFLREAWDEIAHAIVFVRASIGGGVVAVELGDRGILDAPAIHRAVGSGWHTAMYRRTSALRVSPAPFLLAWSAMPVLDRTIAGARSVIGRRRFT
jgi:hypothetical protein